MNSRSKGKRGELELARILTDEGFPARRGQQFKGGPDSPDTLCPSLPIHWERKRVERLNIYEAVEQAIGEAGPEQFPVVSHRRNRGRELVTLRLSDFLAILRESEWVDKPPPEAENGR